MTPAGWYPDPANPGAERFWDGTQWTEHTKTPRPPPPPPTRPPFSPAPSRMRPAPVSMSRHPGGKLNEIGDWLNRSFNGPIEQAIPLSLFFLGPFAVFAIAYLIGHLAVKDVVFANGNISGLNVGLLVAAIAVGVVAMTVAGAAYLAAHYQLYGSAVGQPPDWRDSFVVGFKRLPTLIAFWFLFGVALMAPMVFIVVLVTIADSLAVLILLLPLWFVAFLWLTVKLSLVSVSVVVAPQGTSGVSAGWNSTEGFFWAIFGRMILISIVVNVLLVIQQILAGFLWPLAFGSKLGFDQQGELLVDGRTAGSLDALALADVLPNPVSLLVVTGVLFYTQFMIQTVQFASYAVIYADTGAANSFGHR